MKQIDLTFQDWQKTIDGSLGKTEWLTVFSQFSDYSSINRGNIYSALISNRKVKEVLQDCQWDLRIDGTRPGFSSSFKDGKEIVKYCRFFQKGIEPLVYWRSFHGLKEAYCELSEEFRMYFNLFEDQRQLPERAFFRIDDTGDDEEVAIITKDEVKVKLRYVKEFLAVKKMSLAVYFDWMRFSQNTLSELHIEEGSHVVKGQNFIYSLSVRDLVLDGTKSRGWLLGKKIIPGLKGFKPGNFPNHGEEKYEHFIIGIDEDGQEIYHTCKSDLLADFYGKNPEAPQYTTPVFFRKEVLNKYYGNPPKYSVGDSYLSCQGLWGLRIDNNHPNYVVVYLGDLGGLHHQEQLYWKSFNVSHQGNISRTAWRRGVQAEFTDPEQPDLYFKHKFEVFQKRWNERFGWFLFKPLSDGDRHHFESLHIPTMDNQKEFDEQVLSLTKILIDSLNEKELVKGLSLEKDEPKGIDKLEAFLKSKNAHIAGMIEFLRNLQSLRSTSVAHRKSERGKGYKKVKESFGLEGKRFGDVFGEILIKAIWTLNSLETYVLKIEREAE